MPNPFFRAKEVFDSGDQQEGIAQLERHLESDIGEVVFEPEPRIFFPDAFGELEGAVYSMLDSPTMLKAPFGRAFAWVWDMNPHRQWLGLLLHHEFTDPLDFKEFADLELPPIDFAYEAIVDALTESARRGLLAPNYEGPNNGRPVLRLAEVESVDDQQWGELKPRLLDALPQAFTACPSDFWERLAETDAEGVLTRFLHDLFLDHRPPLDVTDSRWKVIVEQQSRYASAAQQALGAVLAANDTAEYLTEVVRIDAGRRVADGRSWLQQLQEALVQRDLRSMPGEPWPQTARI